ncbi:hypothetical protein GCM10022291_29490 [Postechiella marina]|uniref:Secretion system C-terminal sorting domain-containing protein n=1 Tax=Postechiella marina TaxID=943941 RepID=A0ABP8CG08_9FLAO
MKYVLILCALLFSMNFTHAQVFSVEKIKNAGDNDKRLNLVILSEGYQSTEFDKFKTDAESLVSDMFTQSPFLEYAEYFNVHIIKVPSAQSGADHPGTAIGESGITPVYKDTYFNATFDAFGYHRFLYYGLDYDDDDEAEIKIHAVLADNFPTYDQALILVNTDEYGGTGGEFPISSTGVSGNQIAIHELGHSLFDLKDEYIVPDVFYGEAINMTQENNTSLVKWKNWVDKNGINVYVYGTSGVSATWYRPHQACKMRYLGYPFCSVCKEGMVEKIHSLISPIESYSPESSNISTPSFPLDFELGLIKTIPNTIESVWTLNHTNFANNVDNVSLTENDLNAGTNTLTTVVHDATTLVNIDNHDSTHIYTITWTIENSSLGVNNITSKENNLSFTMFPTPSNGIINFKIDSDNNSSLKIDILTIDGKKVKTILIYNHSTQQVDISNLSNGLYIVNLYSDAILVANKKLIKR